MKELWLGCFEPLGSMIGRGSLSIWTNRNISGRTASCCWLLAWGVGIAACAEMFSELVTPCLSVSNWLAITKHISCLFVCLFEPDIYSVMADNYFRCNLPCAESCPPCSRKCTYTCKHSRCSKTCGQPCVPCKVRVSTCFICVWVLEGGLTGDWRRLHGEKLHDFMLSLCILLCYIHRYIHTGRHKGELYLISRNSNDEKLKRHYKAYCKILLKVIKEAKKLYYDTKIMTQKFTDRTINVKELGKSLRS